MIIEVKMHNDENLCSLERKRSVMEKVKSTNLDHPGIMQMQRCRKGMAFNKEEKEDVYCSRASEESVSLIKLYVNCSFKSPLQN